MNQYKLRPVSPEDEDLLKTVYGKTRSDELNLALNWTDQMKDAFISHQFNAQKDYYSKIYPNADYSVILCGNESAGRLYVERNLIEDNIRIIDISLLPEYRSRGIGTYFLTQLQNEAKDHKKVLSIHVEKFSRALGLYLRLGFQVIKETHGVYLLLHWQSKFNT